MVTVRLSTALRRLFRDVPASVAVEATTVGGALDALDTRWPGMADRIRDTRPAIRRNMNIFVAGERATLATPLAPGATVEVLTAISGG